MTDPRALLDAYAASEGFTPEASEWEWTFEDHAPAAFDALRAVLDHHCSNTVGLCWGCRNTVWPYETVRAITTALGDTDG